MRKIIIILIILSVSVVFMANYFKKTKSRRNQISKSGQEARNDEQRILYYTCGMHPSVRVSPQEYGNGAVKCPICQMNLTPVYVSSDPAVSNSGEMGRHEGHIVSINPKDLALAGIQTYKIKVIPLFKEIRTVGVVAYDPQLRSAQEEYIQAYTTYQKILKSDFKDAKERSKDILESAEIKLTLLGLSRESIKELRTFGKPDRSLILPDKLMWVYADFYEYEAIWPQVGDKVNIISQIEPSIDFKGEIKSIEPVLKGKTRTLRVKIITANKNRLLKPNMYVDVYLKSELGKVLAVPREAVLDTGKRQVIYIDLGGGNFSLRKVSLGPLAQGVVEGSKMDFYPLAEGAKEGEFVALKGNFLIDSQSQLGASSAAYGGALTPEEETMPPEHKNRIGVSDKL